ncbi:hypothetical protein [Stappia sp.]|uniref:hypothetical protein n=1 Tax=Stappia sp. TaxID=1870903 RepID=UPI0032D99BEF
MPLRIYRWEAADALAALRDDILAREAEVLALPMSADWDARHDDVASSRYAHYNLFARAGPAYDALRAAVRAAISHLRAELDLKPKPAYIQCWSNILRAGQGLPQHAHPYPLHGHLNVSTSGSTTRYGTSAPVEIANRPGDLTLFARPGLAHSVAPYDGADARISIAFDLLPVAFVEADPRWRKRYEARSFIPFE